MNRRGLVRGGGLTPSAALFLLAASLGVLGCRAVAPAPPPRTLSVAAERALAEAHGHLRDGGELAAFHARAAAQRARRLAPDWVAPRRILDDLDRQALIGPELLARYEAELARDPDDAATLYLAGRLDATARAEARFRRAIELDSSLSWAYHGLAWTRDLVGDRLSAVDAQRRALTYARGSWERSYFTEALARRHLARGKDVTALDVLLERLGEPDVFPADRTALGVRAAVVGLSMPFGKRSREGASRALRLLRDADLTETEATELCLGLLRARDGGNPIGAAELLLALRARPGPGRDRLAAEVMLREARTPLALGLLARSLGEDRAAMALTPEVRAARFATGELASVVDHWLSLQPAFVLDGAGLPRDQDLRDVVLAARAAARSRGTRAHVGDLVRLGDALVAAGWFTEAGGLAEAMGAYDLDRGLELAHRATAGRALIDSLVELVDRVDTRQPIRIVEAEMARPSKEVDGADLSELLVAMEPRFRRFREVTRPESVRTGGRLDLARSPRLRFGPVGSVVHPGPRYSAMDEALGLGRRGDLVGGLAAEFDAIGRFAVFGEAVGSGGPDGTVLRRVLVEERSGEHFGTPWRGTIAWCDGADLLSRPGRRGARIGGAALHEGYWIDIDTLRGEARVYRELQDRLTASPDLVQRALSVAPLLRTYEPERGDLPPLLGEGDRVRLAVLRERLAERGLLAAQGDLVTLDELVQTTATHEEGHLCDRTRFLPLSTRLWAVLVFFMESGMSSLRVEERLEYRAQLTALCGTPEARLPLAEILTAAEIGDFGVTPHGAAYSQLLRDFITVLRQAVDEHPEAWPALDGAAHLAHQLHRLSSDEVRAIGFHLARREGLLLD